MKNRNNLSKILSTLRSMSTNSNITTNLKIWKLSLNRKKLELNNKLKIYSFSFKRSVTSWIYTLKKNKSMKWKLIFLTKESRVFRLPIKKKLSQSKTVLIIFEKKTSRILSTLLARNNLKPSRDFRLKMNTKEINCYGIKSLSLDRNKNSSSKRNWKMSREPTKPLGINLSQVENQNW